ncbi:MAG: ribulokinase [Victivallaceae bacterium]|nr:ribulokinase [Victivallaceae bacterium]
MAKIVIGVDFGSDSVRAVAVDAGDGRPLGDVSAEYPRWRQGRYCDPAASRFRQHPLDHLEGLEKTVRDLAGMIDAGAVVGLGIDTTACTVAPADRTGTLLALSPEFADDPDAMFLLWKDHSAVEEAQRITAAARAEEYDYTQFCGNSYSAESFFAKVLYLLEHNRKIREAAFTFVDHADWLTAVLCGCTDPFQMTWNLGAAGHKALWNPGWGGLPPEGFFRRVSPLFAGIRDRVYPAGRIRRSETAAGKLSPEWAARFHLPGDVIVSTGAMDGLAGVIGCGIRPGRAARLLGTSASDLILTGQLAGPIPGVSSQMDDSLWPNMTTLELGQSAFGDVYAWFKRFIGYGGEVSWEQLNKDAAAVSPGASGTVALDWFNGRRAPCGNQFLRGALAGLSLGTTPPMVFRALIEATAFGSRANFDLVARHAIAVDEVVSAGGIAEKSPLVMQICADVIQRPIGIIKIGQISAQGAAIYAATAAGVYSNIASASAAMAGRCGKIYRPSPDTAEIYDAMYGRYQTLGRALESPVFATMPKIDHPN